MSSRISQNIHLQNQFFSHRRESVGNECELLQARLLDGRPLWAVAKALESLKAGAEDIRRRPKFELVRELRRRINRTQMGSLSRLISHDFRGPILLVPTPLRSEELNESQDLVVSDAEVEYFDRILTGILRKRGIEFWKMDEKRIHARICKHLFAW